MGRRSYRKRDDEDSPLWMMLQLAYASSWAGAVLSVLFAGLWLYLRSDTKSPGGVAVLFSPLLLILAIVLAVTAIVGAVARFASNLLALSNTPRGKDSGGSRNHSASRRTWHRPPPLPPRTGAPVALQTPTPPRPAESLLSRGEMAFYHPLRDIVAGEFEIHIKPSLADVLQCRNSPQFTQTRGMHVDFLLCDRQTLRPRLVIELDDRYHRRPEQVARDQRKAEFLRGAGIPLLRQRCSAAYDMQELRERISRAVS